MTSVRIGRWVVPFLRGLDTDPPAPFTGKFRWNIVLLFTFIFMNKETETQ